MKVISNEKLIKRNNKIGQITSFASLGILAVGMFYSFRDNAGQYISWTFTSLIVGFLLFQVGNYFLNRWGKSPRPDEIITQSLKGLDDKYTLYHYSTEIPHLLVGPAGVYTLLPYDQNGVLKFDESKKQWKQIGGNIFLKIFGQEGLGKPLNEAKYSVDDVERFLLKLGIGKDTCEPQALLVFTNGKATVEGEGSPIPYTTSEKIKDFMRKRAKEQNFDFEPVISKIEPKIKLK